MSARWDFVIEGVVAGMAHPGRGEVLRKRLRELTDAGFTGVVSLSASAPAPEAVAEAGLQHLHVPVPDFSAPSVGELDRIMGFIDSVAEAGGATIVHCTSGHGRTGTVLASCLVAREGLRADEAVRRARSARPGSVETASQEAAVADYARWLSGRGRQSGR